MSNATKNQYFVNLNLSLKIESDEQLETLRGMLGDNGLSIEDPIVKMSNGTKMIAPVVHVDEIDVYDWNSLL